MGPRRGESAIRLLLQQQIESRINAPPPVITMPRSTMSEAAPRRDLERAPHRVDDLLDRLLHGLRISLE